jgi:DNA invertase Pin-like site-specific DNA recombinase
MSSTESTPFVPAVHYGAKSTQDRHRSIPTQLEDCREKSADEGWTCAPNDEFSDERFSAYSGNRGDGLACAKTCAIELAREHGRCMLVAQAADRFARGSGDRPGAADALVEIWHQLRRQGVELRSVEDDFDLRDSASVANLGQRAHMDSRRKSKSVKKGMKRRRADGKHNGGPRKLGYDYERDATGRTYPDEPLRVLPAEAVVVERIYRDYVAGQSQQAIQRALNAEGVRAVRGGTWYQGTIAKVLADPFYAGFVRAGDNLVPSRHPAIIKLDLWQRAERIRLAGRRSLHPGGRPPARPYLFTNGYLRCGRCGGAMVPRTGTQRKSPTGTPWGSRYEVYQCYTRVRSVAACEQRPVPRAAVDEAALRALQARGVSVGQTRAGLLEAIATERAAVQARLDDARRQERKAGEALERIDRDYAEGALSAANFERLQPRLESELAGARAARQQVERRLAELANEQVDDALAATVATLRKAIAAHLHDGASVDEVRLLLRRLFTRFVLCAVEDGLVLLPELRPDALEQLRAEAPADGAALQLTTAYDGFVTKSSRAGAPANVRGRSGRSVGGARSGPTAGDRPCAWRSRARSSAGSRAAARRRARSAVARRARGA